MNPNIHISMDIIWEVKNTLPDKKIYKNTKESSRLRRNCENENIVLLGKGENRKVF